MWHMCINASHATFYTEGNPAIINLPGENITSYILAHAGEDCLLNYLLGEQCSGVHDLHTLCALYNNLWHARRRSSTIACGWKVIWRLSGLNVHICTAILQYVRVLLSSTHINVHNCTHDVLLMGWNAFSYTQCSANTMSYATSIAYPRQLFGDSALFGMHNCIGIVLQVSQCTHVNSHVLIWPRIIEPCV